jgi:hypothetical protein
MNELLESLDLNLQNDEIDQVRVFIEDDRVYDKLLAYPNEISDRFNALMNHRKIAARVEIGRRMFFSEYFQYANDNLTDNVVVVSNSDIYFDRSIGVLRTIDLDKTFICLAKHDAISKLLWEPHMSQDSWIFVPPIPDFDNSRFTSGCPGCDSVLARSAHVAGMRVINPCLSIIAHHLDDHNRDRWQGYGQPVAGSGMDVLPSKIGE